jgi:hypothetical protein
MNVQQAKLAAQDWVNANANQYQGLRAAHLVGSITTLPADMDFPPYKDVDMHLIFDDGSPILEPRGPFPHILETSHQGLMLEGGYKPMTDYASADVVLANPEIAHHLLEDSVLYDPDGLLDNLQTAVKQDYPKRQWVMVRLEHDRQGLMGIYEILPMARERFGIPGQIQMMGYSFTKISASLSTAKLRAPSTGSRTFLKIRDILIEHNREDLHESMLELFGLGNMTVSAVASLLEEGIEAFDLAVEVRRSPHFFQHKLKAHLKPYFVESCKSLMVEGYPDHAMLWLIAFYGSACEVIKIDGPPELKPKFTARLERLVSMMGMDSQEVVDERWATARKLHEELLVLAHEIAAQNPDIVD